jgi:hypothetical protein
VVEAALFPQPALSFTEVVRQEVEHMRQTLKLMRSEPAGTLEADRRAVAMPLVSRLHVLPRSGWPASTPRFQGMDFRNRPKHCAESGTGSWSTSERCGSQTPSDGTH